jgi:DME family drug/metabolite transporter
MRGYLYILIAAAMWGTIGILFTVLHDAGLKALTIAFLRAALPGAILLAVALIRHPRALKLDRRGLFFFAVFGLIGVALFYLVNVEAVLLTNVSTASVMLYTAPAWVTLVAWRAWGEPLDAFKIAMLAVVFAGIVLVARFYDAAQMQSSPAGMLVAISTGVTYALYTLFSKVAIKQHSPMIVVGYSLLFGALFLLPAQFLPIPGREELVGAGFAPLVSPGPAWLALGALALGPTLGSYLLYSAGLRRVPASNASVIASIEPVVATILGWLVLGQSIDVWQGVGGVMIIAGAVWLTGGRYDKGKFGA